MPWSGGTYTKGNAGTGGWAGDAGLGIGIEAGRHDTQDNDFANGINNALTKDGQNTPTANLPMGGYKHTNCNAATANNEYATLGQLNSSVSESMPSGAIQMYGGSTAPTGYLLCNGGAVSRASYSDLFAVIGTTYGIGDGSTTFNVPDLRQKFPLGKAASGTGNTLGDTGGAIDHTHSVPAHYHGKGDLAVGSSGTHTTSISHDHGSFNASGTTGNATTDQFPMRANSAPGNAGRAMRADASTGSTNDTVVSDYFDHTHSITLAVNVPALSGNSSSTGAYSHSNSDFSGSVGNTGGDNGDSAMTSGATNPPFLVVNYIIKT